MPQLPPLPSSTPPTPTAAAEDKDFLDNTLKGVEHTLKSGDDVLKPMESYDKDAVENVLSNLPVSGMDSLGAMNPTQLSLKPSSSSNSNNKPAAPAHDAGASSLLETLATTRADLHVSAGNSRAVVPPFEELPSVAPHDGLDGDGFGPLANPKPFEGDIMSASAQAGPLALPNVPKYLGAHVPDMDMKFSPAFRSLPPVVAGHRQSKSANVLPPNILPKLILPQHPELPDVDDLGIPKSLGITHGTETPIVPLPPMDPFMPHVDPSTLGNQFTGFGAPSPLMNGAPNPAYALYVQARQQYLAQRAQALQSMEGRRRQIENLQSYVEGGEAWVNQKETLLNQWLNQERAKGQQAIAGEKSKVQKLKEALRQLLLAQKDDARKVNLYNTEMRRAAIQFQLEMHSNQAKATEEQEKRLKQELANVSSQKSKLKHLMDAVNKRLTDTSFTNPDHGTSSPVDLGSAGGAGGEHGESGSGGGSEEAAAAL